MRRRRDGSGRGATLGPAGAAGAAGGAGLAQGVAAAVIAPAPVADVPVGAPAVAFRARTVAVVAKPASCIACGSCVETCPRSAIALEETAVIDPPLCNGCGLCVNDCSYGALALAEV